MGIICSCGSERKGRSESVLVIDHGSIEFRHSGWVNNFTYWWLTDCASLKRGKWRTINFYIHRQISKHTWREAKSYKCQAVFSFFLGSYAIWRKTSRSIIIKNQTLDSLNLLLIFCLPKKLMTFSRSRRFLGVLWKKSPSGWFRMR